MAIAYKLFVPYHQQDTDYYCGPACLQMVLTSLGTAVELLSQDDLYNDVTATSNIDPGNLWYSAPDGMLDTINHRNPDPSNHFFILAVDDTEESISRRMIATLKYFKVATVALVYDMLHWCVVTGYNVSQEPTGFGDLSYGILGFWLKNPSPVTPVNFPPAAPPPHWAFDPCGYGDVAVFGNSDEYVPYDMWRSTYMTSVRNGFWTGKFLALCDPKPPSGGHGKQLHVKNLFNGEKLLSSHIVGEVIMQELSLHGILDNGPMVEIMKNTKPGSEAFLVERLDRKNDFYFIIPIVGHGGEMQALACADARFGHLLHISFASEKGPLHFKPLSREEIPAILGKRLRLKCEDEILIIHPEILSVYPCLVWKPCKESLSPKIPFYMITIKTRTIFVRIDGQIFTGLTSDRGGL